MGLTLILTATITPPTGAVKLVRTDPVARLNDYLQALEFYLRVPAKVVNRIVFIENSNGDLSRLRALADRFPHKPVEFISFYGLDYPARYGRAYGESKLLDWGFEHSATIKSLSDDTKIWKGTGRLRLMNIARMMAGAPPHYQLYCDMRNVNALWMDQRFYSFTKAGYRALLMNVAEELREDLHNTLAAETLMYRLIIKHVGPGKVVPRFRTQPFIAGVSGFANQEYSRGVSNRLKDYTRAITRKLRPNHWI